MLVYIYIDLLEGNNGERDGIMDTIIKRVSVDKTDIDSCLKNGEKLVVSQEEKEIYETAAKILQSGGLVAFPTETVYGLGGDALQAFASEKIYAAKGRPSDNPLIVHIADFSAVNELVSYVPPVAKLLMERFWPGPMTLIFQKKDIVPKETTGGLDTVAIRFPSHPVARKLIQTAGVYIAAPSANASGRPSPTLAQHVEEDLAGRIDMILDGGQVDIGLESTIIDVTCEVPTILRPGFITKEMLAQVLTELEIDPAITEEHMHDNLVAKAPGMKYRHYAPKGQLYLVEGKNDAGIEQVINQTNQLVQECIVQEKNVAVIATEETKDQYIAPMVVSIGRRDDEASVAHSLFSILRKMDTQQVDVIYCESFARENLGQAIMNRLLKAAGYQIIYVE